MKRSRTILRKNRIPTEEKSLIHAIKIRNASIIQKKEKQQADKQKIHNFRKCL